MTKKKLVALVLVCVLVFFCGASYLNFQAAERYLRQEMMLAQAVTIQEVHRSISLFYKCEEKYSEEENLIYLHENLRNTPLFNSYHAEHVAYTYVLTDRQGNIILKSESGAWLENGMYVSLDEYLTPGIKADLAEFKKSLDGDILMADKISLSFNGEEYVPVSMVFDDEIWSNREEKNKYLTVSFNDREVTNTFNIMTSELYNLYNDEAFEEVNAMLEEELKSFDYSSNHGRSYRDDTEAYVSVIETEGDYHFIGFAKYKPINKALASDFFYNQMIGTVYVFIVLTAVVLIIAITMFNRSNSSKKKQQEAVSVGANESESSNNS